METSTLPFVQYRQAAPDLRTAAQTFLQAGNDRMPFPDAELAIVSREKVCGYLLNPAHPVGGPKCAWFASLGYSIENWEQLAADLCQVAIDCEDFAAKPSPYGVKYETRGRIGCAGFLSATVLAIWMLEENSPPRLVTAYPGEIR